MGIGTWISCAGMDWMDDSDMSALYPYALSHALMARSYPQQWLDHRYLYCRHDGTHYPADRQYMAWHKRTAMAWSLMVCRPFARRVAEQS